MALMAFLMLLLAMAGHSDAAAYCLCSSGASEAAMQKAIDYACGSGADCKPILQNGACYGPNTLLSHCSYAVNSYYQSKSTSGGTCDFGGVAALSSTAPSGSASTCVYPSSPGSTTNPTTGTPSTTTPSATTPTGTATTIPGTGSLGPSGSGFSDSSAATLLRANNPRRGWNLVFRHGFAVAGMMMAGLVVWW